MKLLLPEARVAGRNIRFAQSFHSLGHLGHHPAGLAVNVADGATNAAGAAITIGFLCQAMGPGCFQMGVRSFLSEEFVDLVAAVHCPLLSVRIPVFMFCICSIDR